MDYAKQKLADLLRKPDIPTQSEMTGMNWNDLATLRELLKNNPQANQQIAPYEHRAYAREEVRNNPLMAPAYLAMIPGYQLAKALGFNMGNGGQTPASLSQLSQGLMGVYDGLSDRFK